MSSIDQLKQFIEQETKELICETHPEVCALRDRNYSKLEGLILDQVFKGEEPVSVQTAIAEIETELAHAN